MAIVALTLVLAIVASLTAVAVLRRSYPTVSGTERLGGLEGPAQVVRDESGIPHIYASSEHDLAYVQGYVTASDRLWEMTFLRAIGQARLAEIVGLPALEADKFVRTLGWYRVATREAELLAVETRAFLRAYADGVNEYVTTHSSSPPIEFLILGVAWEPWQPADSIVIGKIMAWDLSGNMSSELLRQSVAMRLGDAALKVLFPPLTAPTPPIVASAEPPAEPSAVVAPLPPAVVEAPAVRIPGAEQLAALLGTVPGAEIGSNNWVVSGARTRTGKPLLANDPHLGVRNPSIWYLGHLSGAGWDVAGYSIPGVPGVVIGHNARIAWGVTNEGPDVQDLYIEEPDPADPRRFLYEGRSEAASIVNETIKVKGAEAVKIDVVQTRHGPVITSVMEGVKQTVALRWTALDPGHLVDALYKLDRASSWDTFRAALREWDVPAQNFVYADVDGHIGYQATGQIPIRPGGSDAGDVPVRGSDGKSEWQGYIAFDELPSVFDPPEGLIVTANQRIVDRSPRKISNEHDPGFRAQRIHQLLRASDKLGPDDFSRIQMDVVDVSTGRFLPFLREMSVAGDRARQAQALLREWDGAMRADRVAPAIYWSWTLHMLERVFRDKLGPDLFKQYLGASARGALYEIVGTPDHPWLIVLSDPAHRGRDALAALALDDALEELTRKLGTDMSGWQWSKLHRVTFDHPLGTVLPFLFNIGPAPNDGAYFTVNNAPFDLKKPYAQTTHPSMRMVVDLADLESTRVVYATGQSGHPFAPHWGDLTKKYLEGGYVTLRFATARQGPLEGTLTLERR